MLYKLKDALGLIDARHCNKDLGCRIEIDATKLKAGCVVDLSPEGAALLSKKYPALLEPAGKVKGEAKQAELTAPDR